MLSRKGQTWWPIAPVCLARMACFALLATGCTLPSPGGKPEVPQSFVSGPVDNGTGSFFISKWESNFTAAENMEELPLPKSRTITWTVCLKDRKNEKEVKEIHFNVYGPQGGAPIANEPTRPDGCMNWTEEIAMNPLADEKHLLLERRIEAAEFHHGSQKIGVLANPWTGQQIDPTKGQIKHGVVRGEQVQLHLQGKGSDQRPQPLVLEGVRTNVIHQKVDQEGGHYKLEIFGNLYVQRKKPEGDLHKIELPAAKNLRATIHLMCLYQYAKQDRPEIGIIGRFETPGEFISGNQILFSHDLTLTHYCATTSTLLIGLSVSVTPPATSPNPLALLASFEKILVGGNSAHFTGQSFSMPYGDFIKRTSSPESTGVAAPNGKPAIRTVSEYLQEQPLLYMNKTLPSVAAEKEEFLARPNVKVLDVDQKAYFPLMKKYGSHVSKVVTRSPDFIRKYGIEMKKAEVKAYQAKPTDKGFAKNMSREYTIKACFTLGIDQQSIRSVNVNVTQINGIKSFASTGSDGCIEWKDSVAFNFLTTECRKKYEFTVHMDAYDYTENIPVYINPWETAGYTSMDSRWFPPDQPESDPREQCVKGQTKIFFDYYYGDYIDRFRYGVDEYLGLKQFRTANLNLRPKYAPLTMTKDYGVDDKTLPPGKYLMRYAIVDQLIEDYTKVAALKDHIYLIGRALIEVRSNGSINDLAPIEISNDAFPSLLGNNRFIVEIMPLKDEAALLMSTGAGVDDFHSAKYEDYVDKDTNIVPVPSVAQWLFDNPRGGMHNLEIPNWDGTSLVLHLEKYFIPEQARVRRQQAASSTKESMAKDDDLELLNLNDRAKVQNFAQTLDAHNEWPESEIQDPQALFQSWLDGKEMDAIDGRRLCRYFFHNLWRKPLGPEGLDAYPPDYANGDGVPQYLSRTCVNELVRNDFNKLIGNDFRSPFDVHFHYFVKNPQIIPTEICTQPQDGQPKSCDRRNVPLPQFVESLGISDGFGLSRNFGSGYGFDFGGKVRYMGAGPGFSFFMGHVTGSGQSAGSGSSRSLSSDRLSFPIMAQDAERCVSIQLNPQLFLEKKHNSIIGVYRSEYARWSRQDLTYEQTMKLLSRGILICQGHTEGHSISFMEDYFFIRGGNDKPFAVDTNSSDYIKTWFASLRGQIDYADFRRNLNQTLDYPANDSSNYDDQRTDLSKMQRVFRIGSGTRPGVLTRLHPLPLSNAKVPDSPASTSPSPLPSNQSFAN
ncbi:MAG: hypothetical protein C5B49_12175 [Bdellovibrio sp.]|nr:MAG: hypothetical protein C5B49_12175 [Bdellovibrio sp.]